MPEPMSLKGASASLLLTAAYSMVIRALGPASAFLLALVLARRLGADATGQFFVGMTLVTALATLAKCGLETALQGFIGQASQCPRQIRGIYRRTRLTVWVLGALLAAFWLLAAPWVAERLLQDSTLTTLVRLQALIILPFGLLGLNAAMLKGLGQPGWGGCFEVVAWPSLTLLMLLPVALPTSAQAALTQLAGMYLLAAVIAAVLSTLMVHRLMPTADRIIPLSWRTLTRSGLPMAGVDVMNFALLWLPFLLLPLLADTAEAGVYNVSHRLAALLGLLVPVFASITSVRFARHVHNGDHDALRRLAGQSTRAMTLLALPPVLLMLLGGEQLLELFGSEFAANLAPLHILALGQLAVLAVGPVGYLLAMSGHERQLRNITLLTVLLSLPLALLMLPLYGATGAAWVVASARLGNSLLGGWLVSRQLPLPGALLLAR